MQEGYDRKEGTMISQRHEAAIDCGAIKAGHGRRRRADQYLTALETRHGRYDLARRMLEWNMSRAAHDGRPTIPADGRDDEGMYAHEAVNGTEVRAGMRWRTTPRDATTTAENGSRPVWKAGKDDWGCYRINADGSRTLIPIERDEPERKIDEAVNMQPARLLAIIGTSQADFD